ncbi:hypothetical protein HS048_23745 [Planomonospora sp. ID91781]|uniref:Uncharacterized protein n=1 Tax=Planomonospora sphaerica TaxID=161355 RepID=A0A161LMS4_9ACTN|nr:MULTISPECIES: hypothetical protein [Planomonospora]MBG0823738.1 hypothetical protein [Planomonospora sp. ID91781]GAT68695.1 hypothetical protein PS9374_04360 [Planomonospora sphaerica]
MIVRTGPGTAGTVSGAAPAGRPYGERGEATRRRPGCAGALPATDEGMVHQ